VTVEDGVRWLRQTAAKLFYSEILYYVNWLIYTTIVQQITVCCCC